MYNSDFFRKKILKIRKRKFRQKQFADIIGMPIRKYIRFEKGKYKPNIIELINIVASLKCDFNLFCSSK